MRRTFFAHRRHRPRSRARAERDGARHRRHGVPAPSASAAPSARSPGVQVRVVGTQRGAHDRRGGQLSHRRRPRRHRPARPPQLTRLRAAVARRARSPPPATTADFTLAQAVTTLDQVVVTATGQSERRRESGASTADDRRDADHDRGHQHLLRRAQLARAGRGRADVRRRKRRRHAHSHPRLELHLALQRAAAHRRRRAARQHAGVLGRSTSADSSPRASTTSTPKRSRASRSSRDPPPPRCTAPPRRTACIQVTTKKGRAGKTRWDVFGETGTLNDVNDYPANLRSYGHSASGALRTNCSLFAPARSGSCVAVDSTISNIPIKSSGILQDGNRRLLGLSVDRRLRGGRRTSSPSEYQKEQNVVPSNGLQRMNIRTNLRVAARPRARRAAQHRLREQRAAPPAERQQLLRRRLRLDARQRGELRARTGGSCTPSLCSGGTDTVSFGYYNRGISPYDFFNIDTRQNVQRLTGGLTSNWTPIELVHGERDARRGHQPSRRHADAPARPAARRRSRRRKVTAACTTRTSSTTRRSLNATATWDAMPTLKLTTTAGTQYSDVGFHRTDAYGAKLLAGSGSLAGTAARFAVGEMTNDIRTLGFLGREQVAWRDRVFLTGSVRTRQEQRVRRELRARALSVAQRVVGGERGGVLPEDPRPLVAAAARRGRLGRPEPGLPRRRAVLPAGHVDRAGRGRARRSPSAARGTTRLKPEKSTEREMGFDLGMFDDRFGVEYTHYNKLTQRRAGERQQRAVARHEPQPLHQRRPACATGATSCSCAARCSQGQLVKFDMTVNGSFTKNNLEDLGTDENGVPIPEFTGGFDATQIFRTGLPLGAYYSNRVSYNDANGDGLIACPDGPGSATCEFTVTDEPESPRRRPSRRRSSPSRPRCRSAFARVTATLDRRTGQKLYNLTGVYRNAIFANGAAVQLPDASNLKRQAAAQAAANGYLGGFIEDASFTKLREVALVAHAAAATRGARRRGVGRAHARRPQPPHLDQLQRARSRSERGRAVELQHRRLPDRAAGPLLHRASRAELLRECHYMTNPMHSRGSVASRACLGASLAWRGEPRGLQPGQAAHGADAGRRAAAGHRQPRGAAERLRRGDRRLPARLRRRLRRPDARSSTTTRGSRR